MGSISGKADHRPGVAELFAGVGGFRLGLEGFGAQLRASWSDYEFARGSGWKVVWSNQWEPGRRHQHASDCYVARFGSEGHHSRDIKIVLDDLETGRIEIPRHELLVGGFPCQDYSVATTLGRSRGLEGAKGALWWQIERLVRILDERGQAPRKLFFENVDRLLKSPAQNRGRDFAVILRSLVNLGYLVEWRVVNAADYGFPQRRRRVFIVGHRLMDFGLTCAPEVFIGKAGTLAKAFPIEVKRDRLLETGFLDDLLRGPNAVVRPGAPSPFLQAGLAVDGQFWTQDLVPRRELPQPLSTVVVKSRVPRRFYLDADEESSWRRLKSAKRERRVHPSGFEYKFAEGGIAFPDPLSKPARTITTAEGGTSPSRLRHVISTSGRRLRRLTPVELERLNGFPDGWTDIGMTDAQRAFMMGNALVVGLVQRVGLQLRKDLGG